MHFLLNSLDIYMGHQDKTQRVFKNNWKVLFRKMGLDSAVGIGLCQRMRMDYMHSLHLTIPSSGRSFYLNLKHREAEKVARFWAQLIPPQTFPDFH